MSPRTFVAWCRRWPGRAAAMLVGTIALIGALLEVPENATKMITPQLAIVGIAIVTALTALLLWHRRASTAIRPKAMVIVPAIGAVVVLVIPLVATFRAQKPHGTPGVQHPPVSQPVAASRPRVHLLMVDVSASLRDSRMRDVVGSYIRNTSGETRIALGTFGRTFRLLMTPRLLPTSAYLDRLEGHPPANCTHIYESMLDAGRFLNRYDREARRLVLFTDGNEFRCSDARPRDWLFERDFPECELEIVLLGDANEAEMKRLFPNAQFSPANY